MARATTSRSGSRLAEITARVFSHSRSELVPTRPPIEKVAADARRLHHQLETMPAGASFVRMMGVMHAYDYVLSIACEQLEVPTRITELPDGKPRILERLRLEFLLGECGLRI